MLVLNNVVHYCSNAILFYIYIFFKKKECIIFPPEFLGVFNCLYFVVMKSTITASLVRTRYGQTSEKFKDRLLLDKFQSKIFRNFLHKYFHVLYLNDASCCEFSCRQLSKAVGLQIMDATLCGLCTVGCVCLSLSMVPFYGLCQPINAFLAALAVPVYPV